MENKQYLTYEQNLFIWRGPFETKELVKGAGFIWNKLVIRRWATPDPEKAIVLYEYSDSLAKEALETAKLLLEKSREVDEDIDIPCPDGLEYLPFQKAGIAYAAAKEDKATLIGDEMGLGKTIQTIGLVNLLEYNPGELSNILVICPASLRLNWKKECEKWLVKPREIFVVDGSKSVIPDSSNLVICNYDIAIKDAIFVQLIERKWDLLVLDEAHYCKNPKTKRTIKVLGGKAKDKFEVGLIDKANYKLALTGTAIKNRPKELYPLLNALQPGKWGSFFDFGLKYCGAHDNGWGWNFDGATNMEQLQLRLRSSVMIRRLKSDVLKELPPKTRQVIVLPANGAQELIDDEWGAYRAKDEALAELRADVDLAHTSGDEDAYKTAVLALKKGYSVLFSEISEARHRVGMAKLPKVIEHLIDTLENVDKLVVFAWHKDVIRQIIHDITLQGITCVKLTGESNMQERQDAVDKFQSDPNVRVFVGNILAAGVGITLTAAKVAIFAEIDWVPANITQAEDRIHRYGQTENVLIQHLVFDKSLDAQMAEDLIYKQNVIDRAMDKFWKAEIEEPVSRRPVNYPEVSEEIREATLDALKLMTAMDPDHAGQENAIGWNKIDGRIGHSLARMKRLSDGQVWLGKKILFKYRKRQIPKDISDIIWKDENNESGN